MGFHSLGNILVGMSGLFTLLGGHQRTFAVVLGVIAEDFFYADGSPLLSCDVKTTRTPLYLVKNTIFMPQVWANDIKMAPGDAKL